MNFEGREHTPVIAHKGTTTKKYTKREIKLLKVIANLRGLSYLLGSYDNSLGNIAMPSLRTPEYGAGLPYPDDVKPRRRKK